MAAQQCVRLTDKKVIVIPSKSMPQGISAMIALDAAATTGKNTQLMCDAISRVHTAQITFAARDSVYDGHFIKAGDYIALLEDTLVATGSDTIALAEAVARVKILAGICHGIFRSQTARTYRNRLNG